jgi:hypothetical protein
MNRPRPRVAAKVEVADKKSDKLERLSKYMERTVREELLHSRDQHVELTTRARELIAATREAIARRVAERHEATGLASTER